MLTDERTDAGVIGILIAHLGAFGSGELKQAYKNIIRHNRTYLSQNTVPLRCFNL